MGKRKPVLVIRMGAAHWDAQVGSVYFNLRKLGKEDLRKVIVGIVRAVREAGLVVT